jgi:hypothetical protein
MILWSQNLNIPVSFRCLAILVFSSVPLVRIAISDRAGEQRRSHLDFSIVACFHLVLSIVSWFSDFTGSFTLRGASRSWLIVLASVLGRYFRSGNPCVRAMKTAMVLNYGHCSCNARDHIERAHLLTFDHRWSQPPARAGMLGCPGERKSIAAMAALIRQPCSADWKEEGGAGFTERFDAMV